ncbi:FecR domain-containing protein [Bacteroidota bacterium]
MNKSQSEPMNEQNIIVKILNGDYTEQEASAFEQWLKEDPQNKIYFEELKEIWMHSGNSDTYELIDPVEDWKKVKNRMNFEVPSRAIKTRSFEKISRYWRVAAVFIALLSVGFLAKQLLNTTPQMITFTTGAFKDNIELPDGSHVYLNKQSALSYPEKFQRKNREVKLQGEGYLEVAKNPKKPFLINIDDQAYVKVLGTSFNIKSDKKQGSVDVSVVSGSVAFFIEEKNKITVLQKHDAAVLRKGVISINNSNNNNFLSWNTGILQFENEIIGNVIKDLSEYYNKEFILDEKIDDSSRLTSTFDKQNLESVLEEMKLVLGLDYLAEGDTIILFNPKQ